MPRAREIGITIGAGEPGPFNAITDVPAVRVGYTTLIEGSDVRTGVTVIMPFTGLTECFAGVHRLNGNGEMTGWHYIQEMGTLASPIAITNTHSVGAVHAALIAHSVGVGGTSGGFTPWALPVVAETYDGRLNDINGFHVRAEHVDAAIASARGGAIQEGNVGGGTGMICHGFKGGTGTASRVLPAASGGWTVGVLVQANHGRRQRLRIDGAPVGSAIPPSRIPLPGQDDAGQGSIIVIVATNAPLLPSQCTRLAQRAALGIGATGGLGEDSSGDLILAFATANHLDPPKESGSSLTLDVEMLRNSAMNPLFEAVVECTEEAIVNALLGATSMQGRGGVVAHALDPDLLVAVLDQYGRGPQLS